MAKTTFEVVKTSSKVVKIKSDVVSRKSDVVKISPDFCTKRSDLSAQMLIILKTLHFLIFINLLKFVKKIRLLTFNHYAQNYSSTEGCFSYYDCTKVSSNFTCPSTRISTFCTLAGNNTQCPCISSTSIPSATETIALPSVQI